MQKEYISRILEEIRLQSALFSDYCVVTVFIGGGTPSVLKASDIVAIMEALKTNFSIASDAEITIEANPGTVKMESCLLYTSYQSRK